MTDREPSDQLGLLGKVALVTGASRGIGAAIARAFSRRGVRVMITARKAEELERAAEEIGGETGTFAGNVGDPDAAIRCVSATIERYGSLDILVNNAGANPYFGPMIDTELAAFEKTVRTNLEGPLMLTQQAWRQFMRAHGGSVINIASIGGIMHGGGLGNYDVSKAALIHMTQHLATELGPGVRVNAIAPGLVKTHFARALWDTGQPDRPWPWAMRRIGSPDDIANAALYLAADLSSWVTGQVLVVDGGASLGSAGPGQ